VSLSASYPDINSSSEFVVGTDKFEDLRINQVDFIKGFHYFKDTSKPLTRYVDHFVLKRTSLSEKAVAITLIQNHNGKFEPRFDFKIINRSKKAAETLKEPVTAAEDRLVKAHVNLDDCHDAFSQLLAFLEDCSEIEMQAGQYVVVTNDQKKQLDDVLKHTAKETMLEAVSEQYGNRITEQDINVITKRKSALGRFKKLLEDETYFKQYQAWLESKSKSHRREDVWQHFFENNTWIFGYGLQLVACEALDDHKLETIVVGSDLFDGAGKRIDGLLKTKGVINRSLFTEIKLHDAQLLEKYDRPAVWAPGKELRGAVAQIQKTLHKVTLKVSQNLHSVADKDGNPTGETIAFVKPRGLVLIGTLDQFSTEKGINEEMFASFELYRQQITGLEVLTYDELYERARFIVEQ
jgi:hypothetical protein